MIRSRSVLLVLAVLFGFGGSALAEDDAPSLDERPHVTMLGHAHAEIAPDLATITLGVVFERPAARDAADAVAHVAHGLVEVAKTAGIAPADIRTQSLTLTQTFDEVRDPQGHDIGRKPRGFEAGETFAIRVRDLQKAGTLAQALLDKGANRFDGISFSLEHPEPIVARLTADAVRDAKAQAEQAAQAAGSRLGPVLQIEPASEGGVRPTVAYAARLKSAAPPIEPGASELDVTVQASWALDAP